MVHRTWFVFAAIAFVVALPVLAAGGRLLAQPRAAALPSALSNVTRVEITRREPLAGGLAFGSTGSYEKLVGTAYLEVDPDDPRNALIVDLDKAPRNARGMVEYSTDLYLLKPLDLRKGNGKIFQVNNRGNKGTLGQFNDGTGANDPSTRSTLGTDSSCAKATRSSGSAGRGHPAGRQPHDHQAAHRHGPGGRDQRPAHVRFDVARQIPMGGAVSLPLSGRPRWSPTRPRRSTRERDPHRPRLSDDSRASHPARTLGVRHLRAQPADPARSRTSCPAARTFAFARLRPRQALPALVHGPKPEADGLGFAATRDLLSFLRYASADAAGNPNPLAMGISQVYCWGTQTGRYMRSFVYLGFNADTEGRRVCDGALVQIAAAQQLALNTRFASAEAASQ